MSTFGSTTEDQDGVPKNIDRGPPEEMRMTEAELRGAMKDVHKAKLTMGEIATVESVMTEMKVLRQMVDDMTEQHNRIIGMIGTLRNEFTQYQQQRAIELQSWIAKNGGSTTPEDN
jgi:hypothetical protein